MNPRNGGAFAALVLGLGLGLAAAATRAQAGPVFDETPCDLPGLPKQALSHLQCGLVKTSRHGADGPTPGIATVPVVIVRDPAGHGTYLSLAAEHDIVLIDPLGDRRSGPSACGIATILAVLPPGMMTPVLLGDRNQAIIDCQEQLRTHLMPHMRTDTRLRAFRTAAEHFEMASHALQVDRSATSAISYESLTWRLLDPDCYELHRILTTPPVTVFIY